MGYTARVVAAFAGIAPFTKRSAHEAGFASLPGSIAAGDH
jgi:hypothetical protein